MAGADGAAEQPATVPRLVISTDVVPARDRAPFFREVLSKVVNSDVDPLIDGTPHYAMDYVEAGPIGISRMQGTPTRFVRQRTHLRDSDGNFTFVLLDRGVVRMTHNGRADEIPAGGAYLVDNSKTTEALFPHEAETRVIRVSRAGLRALTRDPEAAAGGLAGALSAPSSLLLRGYLNAFAGLGQTSPETVRVFGMHVVDLIAAIIGTTRDGAAQAANGIKAARLKELLSTIAGRACEPDFTIEVVAAQLAVTSRYVNRLLEETGSSFTEHVVEHRLRRAWRVLCDPNCTEKIASVAFDTGFNDLSTFNRAFRRRFGETPTAVRGAARIQAPGAARPSSGLSDVAAHVAAFSDPGKPRILHSPDR